MLLKLSRTVLEIGILAVATLAMPEASHAAKFSNRFIEFELPPQWQCSLEGSEWVCQNTDDKKKREAIIVMAAKMKGDQDSLDQYSSYLKTPKSYKSVQGKPITSEVKNVETKPINGQNWVDALHLESEIPGFYTRYLGTTREGIAVLVTYSVNKAKYQEYVPQFENLVKTLKVFYRPGSGLNANPANTNIFNSVAQHNPGEETVIGGINPMGGSDSQPKPKKKDDDSLFLILVLGAAVGGFILWKKRQNQD